MSATTVPRKPTVLVDTVTTSKLPVTQDLEITDSSTEEYVVPALYVKRLR